MYYTLLVFGALLFALDISELVNYLSKKINILHRRYILYIITSPMTIIFPLVLLGNNEAKHILNNDFNTFVEIQGKEWGLVLNNNNSLIVKELNADDPLNKIKIIKIDEIDYIISKKEVNNDKNETQK